MSEAAILEDIKKRIAENKIMVFLKGTPRAPMCGFSDAVCRILDSIGKPYGAMDILPDPRLRQVLSGYSQWPTIPQVFIGGEFVGGCDIVRELHETGELRKKVEAVPAGEATA